MLAFFAHIQNCVFGAARKDVYEFGDVYEGRVGKGDAKRVGCGCHGIILRAVRYKNLFLT